MILIKRLLFLIILLLSGIVIPLYAQQAGTPARTGDTTLKAADTVSAIKDTAAKPVAADTVKTTGGSYTITGKVVDYNSGEGLPFATVFFPNSQVGTPTDLDGNFQLKADVLPGDTLRAQALGYATYNHIIRKDQHELTLSIELQRTANQLNEVVVHATGVDPALLLMKHIIAKKPDNDPDRTENYKYQAYNKLELDIERLSKADFEKIPGLRHYSFVYDNLDTVSEGVPFLPVYLTETLSDYYYRKSPKKQREFIRASLVKGVNNESATKFLGNLYQQVNVYKNFIPVFDKQFISPISNAGPFYYKYTIKDTEKAYGHNIILMQFTPRRPGENCFTGDFWVVDSLYAIQRISMDVPKVANINYVNRISLYQEFAPINDTDWFFKKDKFVAAFNLPYGGRLPGFIGRKTTSYSQIAINKDTINTVLNDKHYKEDVIVNDSARKQADDYWAVHRPDSLTKNEKAVYKMIDTINQMPITTFYKNTVNFLVSGVRDVGPVQLGPYFYIYSNNPVEGNRIRISLGTPAKFSKDVHFTGYFAYGTKDDRFKYGFTGLWLLDRSPRMYLYGSYVHDMDFNTNYYDQIGADNIFSALFRKNGIPWKLAFSNISRFEFYKEYYSGFSHKFIINHREFMPYAPLPYEDIFFDKEGNPTNQVTNTEVGVDLRYAYKEKFLDGKYLRVSLGSRYPIISLSTAAGLKNVWNSGYDYQKVRLSVSNTLKIAPFGRLHYNLFAGKYFGTLPYPLLEIHPGNEYYYYNSNAFEMMNKYEFISDRYAGFNIEHNIGGGIFNYIPGVKKLKLRQFWTAKGVIGDLSNANEQLNFNKGFPFRSLAGSPYMEVGTGISNILELFRIDFVWRVTPPPLPEEAQSKYFGIFGSVQFVF